MRSSLSWDIYNMPLWISRSFKNFPIYFTQTCLGTSNVPIQIADTCYFHFHSHTSGANMRYRIKQLHLDLYQYGYILFLPARRIA